MPNFELIVRAIVQVEDKILLCRGKGKDNYFCPGGHIEWGESAEQALRRELREELGVEAVVGACIGMSENFYTAKDLSHHEMNAVFRVSILAGELKSREDHLEFCLVSKQEFGELPVFPTSLKEKIVRWFDDGQCFWASEMGK